MNAVLIIPALLLGLASSLHCVGMCGPLSLMLPVNGSGIRKYTGLLAYQAGRITTYVLVGIIAGLIGRGVLLAGYQQLISVLAGVIILVVAVGYYAGRRSTAVSFLGGFYKTISGMISRAASGAGRPGGAFLFGMANGLLPCGMVYIAAVMAISYGSVIYAGWFMLFFGWGTLPAMLLFSIAGRSLMWKNYRWFARLTPAVITIMGLLLVIRGLNWDIPYLSPALNRITANAVSCHY